MRNKVNKNWQHYLKIVLVMLLPLLPGFTPSVAVETTCPSPQVSVTGQSTGWASFSWNAVSGATEYVVFYIRQDDNYTSPQTYIPNTSITYSGLSSGTYNFYFATVCGGELSEIIIIEDLVV